MQVVPAEWDLQWLRCKNSATVTATSVYMGVDNPFKCVLRKPAIGSWPRVGKGRNNSRGAERR